MALTQDLIRSRLGGRAPRRALQADSIQAAVALLIAPSGAAGGGLDLLMIKRAEQPGDPWSGQMALPGGRRDPGDRDLLATATRETQEEVGIVLSGDWLMGELDDLRPVTPTLPPVVVRPFVFGLATRPAVTPSAEVALHVWVPLEDLIAGRTRTEFNIPGRARTYPAFRVGEHVVWGMTERIIRPFIELLS